MKSISTTSFPICTSSLIIPLGITIQVRIHNFSPTSLIYHHSFHIKSPNSKCDHKGIVMGLESSYFISFGKAQDWRLFASFPLGFLVIFSNPCDLLQPQLVDGCHYSKQGANLPFWSNKNEVNGPQRCACCRVLLKTRP